MKKKILHLEISKYSKTDIEELKNNFDVIFLNTNSQAEFKNIKKQNNFFGIFTKLGLEINKEILSMQPHLKYIITPTTGLNHIDIDYAENNGITVISLKGEEEFLKTIRSTAEHTWAILLMLMRNLDLAFKDVKNGFWRREPFLAEELDDKIIGIIGMGRLGKMIVNYAEVFNMKVMAYDINPKVFKNSKVRFTPLNLLLSKCDILSIHIPSDKKNYNFIDSEKISLLKKEAFIINTSRGEIIDEDALLQALVNKEICGAAIDVLQGDSSWGELSPKQNNLISYSKYNDNLIITPHMGGYGKTSIYRTREFITKKFFKVLKK